jgi:outer membrane protein OmpA-like peptidoglycan-associated protein
VQGQRVERSQFVTSTLLRMWGRTMTWTRTVSCAFVCIYSLLTYGQEIKVKGMITSRTGDEMTIRTAEGDQIVALTDDTKAQVPSGVFRHKETSMAELIPGLAVEVKGIHNGDKVVAETVKYTKQDLKTANAVQAGLTMTQQNVAENREAIASNKQSIAANKEQVEAAHEQISANQAAVEQRFADLTDYDVRGSTIVYFPIGKATLTSKNKAALLDLARKATMLKGYLIEVKGYCPEPGTESRSCGGGGRFPPPAGWHTGSARPRARRNGRGRTDSFQRDDGRTGREPTRRGEGPRESGLGREHCEIARHS